MIAPMHKDGDDTLGQRASELRALVKRGVPLDEAESIVGITAEEAAEWKGKAKSEFMPTPDEIRSRAAQVRRRWSADDHAAHWTGGGGRSFVAPDPQSDSPCNAEP